MKIDHMDSKKDNGLLPDGEYYFEVLDAEDKISKKGNEYISLRLKLWDDKNNKNIIFDNLFNSKLIKHFCLSSGLINKYNEGELNSIDCLNKTGKAYIKSETKRENPNGGYYPDRNIVSDYLMTNDKLQSDDIPF